MPPGSLAKRIQATIVEALSKARKKVVKGAKKAVSRWRLNGIKPKEGETYCLDHAGHLHKSVEPGTPHRKVVFKNGKFSFKDKAHGDYPELLKKLNAQLKE